MTPGHCGRLRALHGGRHATGPCQGHSSSRGAAGPGPAHGDPPVARRAGDGQVALAIGAMHLHAVPHQVGQGAAGRVAVRVVGAHRDQRDPRAGCRQEPRIGVGAAVVRDLEHVGPDIDPPVEDAGLRLGAQVAGEEDPHAALGDPHEQAQVVGRGRRRGDLRRGRQHLDRGGADRAPVARNQRQAAGSGMTGQGVDAPDPVVGRREGAGRYLADAPAPQGSGQAGHVVGIEVRKQHEWHVVDGEPPQAPVLGGDVGTGVDQHRLVRTGRHDQRIPLPHVAGNHVRGRGRPAADHLPERPPEDDQTGNHGEEDQPGSRPSPQQDGNREHQQREQDGTRRPGRPGGHGVRDPCRPVRHEHQPAHRPPGQPHQPVGQRRHER